MEYIASIDIDADKVKELLDKQLDTIKRLDHNTALQTKLDGVNANFRQKYQLLLNECIKGGIADGHKAKRIAQLQKEYYEAVFSVVKEKL